MHYDVEIGGVRRRVELPFVTAVLADLSGQPLEPKERIAERQFVSVTAETLDSLMASIRPRVAFTVANALTGEGNIAIDLTFQSIEDFSPTNLVKNIALFRPLVAARAAYPSRVDELLDKQLSVIVHDPLFQRLEATWRSLHRLVTRNEAGEFIKIRVLNISKQELARTLRMFSGTAWNQGPVFKKVFNEGTGRLGGEPFGLLVGDYEFSHERADTELLQELSAIAAAAHAPFVAAASPELMNMESWQELNVPRDLAKIFMTPDYARWRSLRENPDSHYIAFTLPRFPARSPYKRRSEGSGVYEFDEDLGDGDHTRFVWGNTAFLLAENIHRSFLIHGWASYICGVQTGGAVEGLPSVPMRGADAITEVDISTRRSTELSQLGLIPLVPWGDTGIAEFVSTMSLYAPAKNEDPETWHDALAGARLQCVLAGARIAHYVRAMSNDQVLRTDDLEGANVWIAAWVAEYVDPNPDSPGAFSLPPRPLAFAEIELTADHDDDIRCSAQIKVRPNL
jgi:type VI secretion system protein ImpC